MDQGMTCPTCGAYFATEDEMKQHGKEHNQGGTQQNKQALKCPMCGATFSAKEEMDKHAKEAHNQNM